MTDVTQQPEKSQHYDVGQILFVLSSRYHKVFPVMVVKETISKTVRGEVTSYAAIIHGNAETEYDLQSICEQLNGSMYDSIDDIRSVMLERATTAIDLILSQANQDAKQFETTSTQTNENDENK
jgi:hypothetical protein